VVATLAPVPQKIVQDIRVAQFIPGALEFDSHKRVFFYACPCGCGMLGWVDYVKRGVVGPRDKLTCPAELGLILERDNVSEVHWRGWLKKGEWITEEAALGDVEP
jgi:hypothetical protein